jgi:hypothetical protein
MITARTIAARRLHGAPDGPARVAPRVAAINALEPNLETLSDDQLRARTVQFRMALGTTPDDPPVREAGTNEPADGPHGRRK